MNCPLCLVGIYIQFYTCVQSAVLDEASGYREVGDVLCFAQL